MHPRFYGPRPALVGGPVVSVDTVSVAPELGAYVGAFLPLAVTIGVIGLAVWPSVGMPVGYIVKK